MAQLEFLDPSARPFSSPQSVVVRTTKAPALGHLLHSLGLVVAKHTADDGSLYLTARCAGLLLKIVAATAPSDPRETTLHFGVDSLDAALKTAAERKADILKPPHDSSWGKRAIIADPDGRRIILAERGSLPAWDANPSPPTGITIKLPGDFQSESQFINPSSKPAKRPEDAATPPDIMPAISAAKRAIVTMLLGGTVFGIMSAAVTAKMIERDGIHRLNRSILEASFFGHLLSLVVLLLFIFPRSPRLRYGTLWTAFGISAAGAVIGILYGAKIGERDTTEVLSGLIGLIGLASPLLVYNYLAQLTGKAEDAALVRLVDINTKLYFAAIGLFVATVATMAILPPLAIIPMIVSLIGNIAQLIFFIILTVRLLRFRPIRPKKPDVLFIPKSLNAADKPIRTNPRSGDC